jgi:protein-disulfide isomerase
MLKPSLASQPEDTPPARRSPLALVVFLILGFFAGLAVGYFSWGRAPIEVKADQSAASAQAPKRYDVPIGTAPIWGPQTAPITIIEFSDYECPYCKKWTTEIWPQIKEAYPEQIRLVYKDFPLYQSHPNASPAASAARCANDQNKYWLYHDRIFASSRLSAQLFESIATSLGLDVAQWKDCVSTNKYKAEIEADYNYGAQLGITGTPTFFVNGLPMVGAQPFSAFKQVIDQELAALK